MSLSAQSLNDKSEWLAPSMMKRLRASLAEPGLPDEVPMLDGDPFTDSQDAPSAFTVGRARIRGNRAELFVRFHYQGGERSGVLWQLQRQGGRWRVVDLRYPGGTRLSELVGC